MQSFVNLRHSIAHTSLPQHAMVTPGGITAVDTPFRNGGGEVSQFVRAAITKYHTLNGLNNRNLFPHSSGGWRSEIKVLTGVLLNSCRISVYRLKFVSLNKSTCTIPVEAGLCAGGQCPQDAQKAVTF